MNRLLTCAGALALAFTAHSALAADMPRPVTKAPAMVAAPLFNWTGFYVGAQGGGVRGKTFWQDGADDPLRDFSDTAFIGGVTAGYNWQAPGSSWVFGVETDYSWSNHKATTGDSPEFDCVDGCESSLKQLATLRLRAGPTYGSTLFFITGGAAYGRFNATIRGDTSTDYSQWGWTLGAGVETALDGNWSAKAEYLYVDFGREENVCCLPGDDDGSSEYFRAHVVRVGLNYRFATGGKAPVGIGKMPAASPAVVTKY